MRIVSKKIGLAACLLLGVQLVVCVGCVLPPAETDSGRTRPSELPSEINYVIDNRDLFATGPDEAFAEVEPGTVIDALGGLSGCWGSYYRLTANGSLGDIPAGTPLLDSYEQYRFDAETGTVKYQVYQRTVFASHSIFAVVDVRFAILDESRIEIVWEQATFSDPNTGEVITETYTQDDAPRAVFLLSLGGEQLRLRNESSEGPGDAVGQQTAVEYERRVFRLFECP